MTDPHRLSLFLEAAPSGGYRLVTEEGRVILERPTYPALRRDIWTAVTRGDEVCSVISVLIGRPARSPDGRSAAAPPPRSS
jgi:hypothetical protein